jgi:hypothetical protein
MTKHWKEEGMHHRRAYGAHRRRTPERLARDIAHSIALREAEGRPWTWQEYGLAANAAMQALVREATLPAGRVTAQQAR